MKRSQELQRLQDARKYQLLVEKALAWQKEDPSNSNSYFFEGNAKYYSSDIAGAISAWEEAKKRETTNPQTTPQTNSHKIQTLIDTARRIQQRFPDMPPLKFVVNDVDTRARTWSAKARQLLASHQYDEIEKVATKLTQDRSEGADGIWDVFSFAAGLQVASISGKDSEAKWRANHAQIVAWNRARPGSALAQLMLAESWSNGAWVARGETLKIASPEKMEQRLSIAAPLYEKLKSVRQRSPLYFYYRLRSAHLIPVERSAYESLFQQADKAYPNCTGFYLLKAYYLLPRWYGEPGEWEQFAEQSAAKLQGEAGDMLYARIIWKQQALFKTGNQDIWVEAKISWPRIRSGFQALLKRWPNSLAAATNFYYLALLVDPQATMTANNLLQNSIGGQVDQGFWKDFGGIDLFSYNRILLLENVVDFGPSSSDEPVIAGPATTEPRPEEEPIHIVAPLPDGLMGTWTGDGDALDSLVRNNARLYGTVTYVAGMVGQAFYLDGKSFVKVPTSELNPGRGPGLTLEMWVKPDDLAQRRPVAGWGTTSTPGVSLWIEPASPGQAARLGADLRDSKGGSHRLLSDGAVILAKRWQHIALTYNRQEGVVSLYVNGKSVGQKTVGDLELETGLDFTIGKHAYIEQGKITFQGAIDEVSVFSRAIDLAQIQAIYSAASAGKQLVSDDLITFKGQPWQSMQKRLSSFAAQHGGHAMSFAAYIDGSDFVHIQGDKVWFVHRSWQLPGKQGGSDEPTRVNGAEWFPKWDGNISDKWPLSSPLFQAGVPALKVDVLRLGGKVFAANNSASITIVQNPTAANNSEAILLINDDQDGGAHWFIFSLAWDETETGS